VTVIERPREAVFDFVATEFFRNYPRWAPEVKELAALSPGPLRVGSLGRQVRVDFGRRSEATFRVARLEPGALIGFEGLSMPFTIAYAFAPFGDHTRVTLTFQLLRLEFYMRPFERLIRSAARDSVGGTMRQLKRLAELEIAPGAAAVPDPPAANAAALQIDQPMPPAAGGVQAPGEPPAAPAPLPPAGAGPDLSRA
jgi:hypothetical protein